MSYKWVTKINDVKFVLKWRKRAEYVAALVGHSQEYKITLETYADNINVKLLSSALLKLNYGF